MLGRLRDELDGRLVWSTLTDQDYLDAGAGPQDTEGLIDLLSQSATADVAILFKQDGDRTRISVRTREGGVDATVLSARFGGGGHARAAGATVALPVGRCGGRRAGRGTQPARPRWTWTRDALASPRGRDLRRHPRRRQARRPTSHDVVALVRRLTGVRRVGHGGTLDPFAGGVLPVFVGHATRLVEYHLADDKAYRAMVAFGARSTTDDLDGELTPGEGPAPARTAVEAALAGFRGGIEPGAARLLRGARAGPTRLRAGSRRRDDRSSRRATSRSVPSSSSTGMPRIRLDRPATLEIALLGGHLHPGHRARPRRGPRLRRLPRRPDAVTAAARSRTIRPMRRTPSGRPSPPIMAPRCCCHRTPGWMPSRS